MTTYSTNRGAYQHVYETELVGLPVRITGDVYFGSTLPGGPDPSMVDSIKAEWLFGVEVEWELLLALYAAEHDLPDHDAAEDALADEVFERAENDLYDQMDCGGWS